MYGNPEQLKIKGVIYINKVVIVGRLTKDCDLKFAQGTGNAVTTFTVAVNRRFKREGQPEADFIPVVVFGKVAEACANYTSKGKLISVSGGIQTRTYDAKDGIKRYVTEVIAEKIHYKKQYKKVHSGKCTRVRYLCNYLTLSYQIGG